MEHGLLQNKLSFYGMKFKNCLDDVTPLFKSNIMKSVSWLIEIMLETHSSNPQVHSESICNVWGCFMTHIRFDEFQYFLVFLSFSPHYCAFR